MLTTKKIFTFISLITLSACTNMAELKNRATNTLTNPAFSASTVTYTHTLQNVNIAQLTTGSPPDWGLSLSVVTGSQPLTQYCSVGTTNTKPCSCVLTWQETNTVGGNTTTVPRTKKLTLTAVQSGLVKCSMTDAFWNEIPSGTVMRMNIVAVSPNTTGLTVQSIGYKKGTSTAPAGDFVDDTLTPFRNIIHYTCFTKSRNDVSHEILNSFTQATATQGTTTVTYEMMMASQLCGTAGANCLTPRSGYSAQSYYRNLFVRSDLLGTAQSSNARYDCPKVLESISYSANTPLTIPAAEQNRFWPRDTTFAVATATSSEWSVPIPAASVLMVSGNNATLDDTGINASDRLKEFTTTNAGIAWKMLGYGKKPNANGTCGTILDNNGLTRPLTRLRRYRVVYPSSYQNSGNVAQERPEADQIYVADRLVVDTTGKLTGNMIYGPKPCNFSWFDHEGVTDRSGGAVNQNFQTNFSNSLPSYKATSKYYLKDYKGIVGADIDVNPDGRILPNFERDGTSSSPIAPSCSAAISIYDDVVGVPSAARMITSYYNRSDKITLGLRDLYLGEIHMNPVQRWNPEYVEDTSFQACVPISDAYVEPPLHFYKNAASEVAWCSKVYPTQNPHWIDLNAKKHPNGGTIDAKVVNWGNAIAGNTNIAQVPWFTSHEYTAGAGGGLDQYNSCSSTAASKVCELSLETTAGADYATCLGFLGNASGASANRCDRTVMFDAYQDYRGFPLQSGDEDIQDMLSTDLAKDKKYSCTYSVNSNPSKVNKDQPLSNCCGVKTGVPILDINHLPVNMLPGDAHKGHLEPYINAAFPNIRFCGNPVE